MFSFRWVLASWANVPNESAFWTSFVITDMRSLGTRCPQECSLPWATVTHAVHVKHVVVTTNQITCRRSLSSKEGHTSYQCSLLNVRLFPSLKKSSIKLNHELKKKIKLKLYLKSRMIIK